VMLTSCNEKVERDEQPHITEKSLDLECVEAIF
jgi:hypothetical protein